MHPQNRDKITVRLPDVAELIRAPLTIPAATREQIRRDGYPLTQAGVTRWLIDPERVAALLETTEDD